MAGVGRRPAAPAAQGLDTWQLLERIASVVAPPTLAAALLYWFGLQFTLARLGWFGVQAGVLGYSTIDYVVRGVQAGIVPLIVLMLAVLVVVLAHAAAVLITERYRDGSWFGPAARSVLVVAALATALGAYGVFRPLPWPLDEYLLPPMLLALGPLVALYAASVLASPEIPTPSSIRLAGMAVAGLVVLSVFWAASSYADALGRGRARALASDLTDLPAVTLYSQASLAVDGAHARAEPVTSERFSMRYTGLRLLTHARNRYFLLSDDWTRDTGVVLVIPDGPEVRVEFKPGG